MSVGRLVPFEQLAKNIQSLIEESIAVREIAYCPYSKFKVGAAVLTKSGSTFSGCNVENAAYGLTICAERTALVKAVSSKELEYSAIAVCGELEDEKILPPCGQCRQFIEEFSKTNDIWIYLAVPRKSFSGCNVENAAYGLCICAERAAIVKAVSSNEKELSVIAVCAEMEGDENVKGPCGACRQFIAEFASDSDVLLYSCIPSKKKVLEVSIKELLPLSFHF